jgi:hypothetical protein
MHGACSHWQVLLIAMETCHSAAALRVLAQNAEDLAAAVLTFLQDARSDVGEDSTSCNFILPLCIGNRALQKKAIEHRSKSMPFIP